MTEHVPRLTGVWCDTCRFWRQMAESHYGFCHRHPPRPLRHRSPDLPVPLGVWPITLDDDWCGEHEAP